MTVGDALPLEAARPASSSRGHMMHQRANFQQNWTMLGLVIDDLTNFQSRFWAGCKPRVLMG